MNVLTQFSLASILYLILLIVAALYNKFGKRKKVKKVLKEDIAPISLLLLVSFNVIGLFLWIGELIC